MWEAQLGQSRELGGWGSGLAHPHKLFIAEQHQDPEPQKRGARAGDGASGRDSDTEQNKRTRPTKGKMKSRAFAHPTVPGLASRGLQGGAQPMGRVRMGARGRLERGRGPSSLLSAAGTLKMAVATKWRQLGARLLREGQALGWRPTDGFGWVCPFSEGISCSSSPSQPPHPCLSSPRALNCIAKTSLRLLSRELSVHHLNFQPRSLSR